MNDLASRRLRWVALALFASIAVNCLVVGLLLGQQTTSLFGEKAAVKQGGGGGLGQRVAALPDAERRKFMQAMRPYRPAIREARAALADARQRLADAVEQSDYDQATVTAAFADVRQHTLQLQEKVQDATAVALGTLSEESRRTLVAGAMSQQ